MSPKPQRRKFQNVRILKSKNQTGININAINNNKEPNKNLTEMEKLLQRSKNSSNINKQINMTTTKRKNKDDSAQKSTSKVVKLKCSSIPASSTFGSKQTATTFEKPKIISPTTLPKTTKIKIKRNSAFFNNNEYVLNKLPKQL